ncbi:MAG: hypothetical protein H0T20_00280 [Actinobacteria bacterium]|nr:hypothetical protein [Actinomycetota bacterium]
MQRGLLIIAVLGLFAGTASAGPAPTLRLVKSEPLKLAGRGFAARDLVRLTITSDGVTVRRSVRATPRGAFSASFPAVSYDRCHDRLTATARGRGGSVALKLPSALCPPPLSP